MDFDFDEEPLKATKNEPVKEYNPKNAVKKGTLVKQPKKKRSSKTDKNIQQ